MFTGPLVLWFNRFAHDIWNLENPVFIANKCLNAITLDLFSFQSEFSLYALCVKHVECSYTVCLLHVEFSG